MGNNNSPHLPFKHCTRSEKKKEKRKKKCL